MMKSVLEVYSEVAKNNPPWTSDEEKEAIKKWYRKDRERFVNEAMKHNLALVFSIFQKMSFNKSEDVFQRAVCALVDALRKFKPSKGYKISTWVTNPIRWAIQKEQNAYVHHGTIAEEISDLNRKHNSSMTVVSVDSPIGNDTNENTDTIGSTISIHNVMPDYARLRGYKTNTETAHEADIRAGVAELFEKMEDFLTEKETIVVKQMLTGRSLTEIAVELRLSRMRISQLSHKAIEKIRASSIATKLRGLL